MDNFTRLGFVRSQLDELKDVCRELTPSMKFSLSGYTIGGRKESWFEMGWKLANSKHPVEIFDAPHHERFHKLGQRLFPGNHSCLFLYYPEGAYINPHRDYTASEAWVVQVNIGCPITFTLGDRQYPIEDGEIIGFNSKLLHSVSPATSDRWVVSWRKIKPQYLNLQGSLF